MLVLAGLLLFGTPLRYARTFTASVTEAGGILLQFPFYFGILGVLEASGLVSLLAGTSADMAQLLARAGLPLGFAFDAVTFFSAGLVNLFVPSGGGQWAVQGTIVAGAAADLSLPLPRAVMALSYGDEWTNMLQPFWALALLGITGLKARDILGYTLTVMLAALPLYLAALFWL
jgi:short-chain fatty acids transporter